jgi:hypothetical protein
VLWNGFVDCVCDTDSMNHRSPKVTAQNFLHVNVNSLNKGAGILQSTKKDFVLRRQGEWDILHIKVHVKQQCRYYGEQQFLYYTCAKNKSV